MRDYTEMYWVYITDKNQSFLEWYGPEQKNSFIFYTLYTHEKKNTEMAYGRYPISNNSRSNLYFYW